MSYFNKRIYIYIYIDGLPPWLCSKESACNTGDTGIAGSIPGSGRSPGRGYGNPLQYSCLENPMNRGSGQAIIHRVIKRKSWSRLKSLNMSLQCYGEKNAWRKGFWIGEEKRTIVKASTLATSCEELTHWKDPDAGRDCGQEEKGMTEDEMDGWNHQLNGHEFEKDLEIGDGQGGLACCSPWGCKELDTTEWTELSWPSAQY